MATKSVTLKDSNGDTLYPVTDSNVVNINQQKTLAQALDGVVYAEDPTTQAQPAPWVTSSDIDWTSMVVSTGLQSSTSVAAYTDVLTISLPAGKWKVTTEVYGTHAYSSNATGGFMHCGKWTTISLPVVSGSFRPHEVFVDIVEPTSQTTYATQADFALTYGAETKMIAERIG